ncbi:MAG: BolA family transcriptional regulator [Neisseriaceae bacterium]|nr:BolA family transcriptional regulator [Neisseriaceae bacterium]MBP6862869.1 BolA family transcriptional regulator [Neisseriaceae bacterium]
MHNTAVLIEQSLKKALSPVHLEIIDESHLHIGHAGNQGGGHYAVIVVSDAFKTANRIQRQRIVNEPLSDLFKTNQIHALSIKALTSDEYFS